MIKHRWTAAFLGVVGLSATLTLPTARAQQPATKPVDGAERRAVVARIVQLLDSNYVFPDVARKTGEHIAARLAAGAFDQITDPQAFATRLTAELQSVNHDKHMRVNVRPADMARLQQDDPEAARAQQLREIRDDNYAFRKVEHLDGNIGYVDFRAFAPPELARETAVAAMQFLANSDAIIIDLRQNGGGSPEMVQLICSYFFNTRTHLNSLYWRQGDRTQEFWTLEDVPGRRMPDVPVFILTSRRTFSGAEEFTYDMQTRKRATIVGETTGGGANPGGMMPVNARFVIFVPSGRAINPVTGTNWEGTGVKPDVAVPAAVALDTALVRARAAARAHRMAAIARDSTRRAGLRQSLVSAATLLDNNQAEAAERAISGALRQAIADGIADEGSINALGYSYLQQGKKALAIAVFKFNVATFPKSSNTYDSLGEAYMNNGQRELAIQNYQKSLDLDPNNQNAVVMLKKLRSQ